MWSVCSLCCKEEESIVVVHDDEDALLLSLSLSLFGCVCFVDYMNIDGGGPSSPSGGCGKSG